LKKVLQNANQFDLSSLDPISRDFFKSEYTSARYKETAVDVINKLSIVFNNATFTRMFSNPVATFDMLAEMNAGKVILLNTAHNHLQDGAKLLGRFFITLVLQAARERALHRNPIPTF